MEANVTCAPKVDEESSAGTPSLLAVDDTNENNLKVHADPPSSSSVNNHADFAFTPEKAFSMGSPPQNESPNHTLPSEYHLRRLRRAVDKHNDQAAIPLWSVTSEPGEAGKFGFARRMLIEGAAQTLVLHANATAPMLSPSSPSPLATTSAKKRVSFSVSPIAKGRSPPHGSQLPNFPSPALSSSHQRTQRQPNARATPASSHNNTLTMSFQGGRTPALASVAHSSSHSTRADAASPLQLNPYSNAVHQLKEFSFSYGAEMTKARSARQTPNVLTPNNNEKGAFHIPVALLPLSVKAQLAPTLSSSSPRPEFLTSFVHKDCFQEKIEHARRFRTREPYDHSPSRPAYVSERPSCGK